MCTWDKVKGNFILVSTIVNLYSGNVWGHDLVKYTRHTHTDTYNLKNQVFAYLSYFPVLREIATQQNNMRREDLTT
jgi:hypothetical protein